MFKRQNKCKVVAHQESSRSMFGISCKSQEEKARNRGSYLNPIQKGERRVIDEDTKHVRIQKPSGDAVGDNQKPTVLARKKDIRKLPGKTQPFPRPGKQMSIRGQVWDGTFAGRQGILPRTLGKMENTTIAQDGKLLKRKRKQSLNGRFHRAKGDNNNKKKKKTGNLLGTSGRTVKNGKHSLHSKIP